VDSSETQSESTDSNVSEESSGNSGSGDDSSSTEAGNENKSSCPTTQTLCIGSLTFSGVLAAGSYWLWGRTKNKEVNWWESPKVIMAGIATTVVSAGVCLWSYFTNDDDNDEDKDESPSLFVQPKKSSRKKPKRRKDKAPDEGFSDLTIFIVGGICVTVGGYLIGLCVMGMRTKDFPHVVHEGDELV